MLPSINNIDSGFGASNRRDSHRINIENSRPQEELLVVAPDALNTVIKYHLDGEGHSTLQEISLRQFVLFGVAISGAELYATAADAYAQSEHNDLAGRINYMVSTCVPALVVLYNSTELFLMMRAAEAIPKKLTPYLINSFTRAQKDLEDIAITIGAAISAVPLAAISYTYPIPGFPKIVILLQGIIVLIDNTILHLFPFKLAFSERLYRLPILPIEFLVQQIMKGRINQEDREKQQLQVQINQGYQAIKQRLLNHLDRAQKLLSIYGFKFSGFNYTNQVKKGIHDITNRNQENSATQLLIELLTYLHELAPDQPISAPGRVSQFFRTASYIPGAFWVVSSCAGFLAAPVNEMTALTGSPVLGAALSAPPVYFLTVLLAFFGGNALQNTFDYFMTWKNDSVKIPMAFKLYPKTAVLLVIISMYLSVFSYAAGAQLINDNFNGKLEFLRPYLLDLAKTGLAFLGFTAMVDFLNNTLRKFGQYGGSEDAETVIKLSEAFEQMKTSIQRMKSGQLLESLSRMSGGQLKNFFNIEQKVDQQEFSETLFQLAGKLESTLIKALEEAKLEEAKLIELRYQQAQNNPSHTCEKIDELLTSSGEELSASLKEIFCEYKTVCKLLKILGSVNFISEEELCNSFSDDSRAGSSERTVLITRNQGNYGSFYNSSDSESRISSPADSTSYLVQIR